MKLIAITIILAGAFAFLSSIPVAASVHRYSSRMTCSGAGARSRHVVRQSVPRGVVQSTVVKTKVR